MPSRKHFGAAGLQETLKACGWETPVSGPLMQGGDRRSCDYVMGIPALAALLDPILDEGVAVPRKVDNPNVVFRPNIHAIHDWIKDTFVAEAIWVSLGNR